MLLSVMPAADFSFEIDDAIRVRKRKRTKENAVDQAEDGGIRADAETERDDGDGGKAFMLQEHSNAVTNVVKQRVHDSLGVVRRRSIESRHVRERGDVTRDFKVPWVRPLTACAISAELILRT